MAASNEEFLARWSRRKVDARQGLRKKEADQRSASERRPAGKLPGPGETAALAEGDPDLQSGALEEQGAHVAPGEQTEPGDAATPEETVDASEFDDVDFDKLDFESDYTRFMKAGVPEAIKRRALRKLWHSNPILANVDGLNDYDDDFTDAAMAVKKLVTAWKVGSGYLTEEERKASYGDTPDSAAEGDAPDTDEGAEGGEADEQQAAGDAAEGQTAEAEAEPEDTGADPQPSGRPDDDKA